MSKNPPMSTAGRCDLNNSEDILIFETVKFCNYESRYDDKNHYYNKSLYNTVMEVHNL